VGTAQISEGLTTEQRLGSMHCMQGGRAYARAWVSWRDGCAGHYTIGVRRYMAGGHGSMLWVQPFGDDDVANKIDDLQVLGAISKF